MVKQKEIKIKYPEARVRAINSNLAKKNTTIEVEIMESIESNSIKSTSNQRSENSLKN